MLTSWRTEVNWYSNERAERAHLFDKVEKDQRSICKSVKMKDGDQWKHLTELAYLTVMPCLKCASRNGRK